MTTNDEKDMTISEATALGGLDAGAAALIGDIFRASAAQTTYILDQLYEQERERRQALEVFIEDVLTKFDNIQGGTVAQYEQCVRMLDAGLPFGPMLERYAARHPENYVR